METNALPNYDLSDNPTDCCPRFDPQGWDEQQLHFRDKLFVKAETRSIFHIPINMKSVFSRTSDAIEAVEGFREGDIIILSYERSPWTTEHYFAVCREVPGQQMVRLSGDYLTKVFEGPYKNAPQWQKAIRAFVERQGKQLKRTYFFYTTCPKCAKYYGKNYVVGVAEVQ